jgi:hypothetical protein
VERACTATRERLLAALLTPAGQRILSDEAVACAPSINRKLERLRHGESSSSTSLLLSSGAELLWTPRQAAAVAAGLMLRPSPASPFSSSPASSLSASLPTSAKLPSSLMTARIRSYRSSSSGTGDATSRLFFSLYDINRDGQLDAWELGLLLDDLAVPFGDAELAELLLEAGTASHGVGG